MSDLVKLSVIIPVYNTSEYLAECFDSILGQTLKELEILVVDDGSDDGGWEIIDQYQQQYQNFRAFRQKRKRQGAARNLALQYAQGDYVAFADSDDTIPATAYEKMYRLAKHNNSDMVAGVQQSFNKLRRWKSVPVHNEKFIKLIPLCDVFSFPELLSDISACNRIIKREVIAEKGVVFSEKTSGEDLDFMARIYLRIRRITVLPEVVYNYRARPNANTGRIKSSFFRDRVVVTEQLKDYYDLHGGTAIFPHLLRSELRKLVKNRIVKVVHVLEGRAQTEIFMYVQRLAKGMTPADICSAKEFSDITKTRLLLLWFGEFDALIQSERNPGSFKFKEKISSVECFAHLMPILKRRKLESINPFAKRKLLKLKRFVRGGYNFAKKFVKRILIGRGRLVVSVCKYVAILLMEKLGNQIKERNVWLIDERESQSAEDNSYHLFRYLRETHADLPVYYILDKKSNDWSKVASLGNAVQLYSWKHLTLLRQARVLLATDSFKNLAGPFEVLPFLQHKTHNVFLQHGIVALKDISYTKERFPYFNQVITTNDRERELFIGRYGYSPDEVTATGLARYDKLHTSSGKKIGRKTILLLPTWRKWIRGKKQFFGSTFFSHWNSLLGDDKFCQMLEKNNITAYFYPHFKLDEFRQEFQPQSGNIEIIRADDVPLQDLIIECDMLLTDFSSVMWDFLYQNKPALCFMFDRDDMAKRHNGPPPLDFDEELPAPICYEVDKVVEKMALFIQNEFTILSEHLALAETFFKYRDNENCLRIYESAKMRAESIK